MPCFHPLKMYPSRTSPGQLTMRYSEAWTDLPHTPVRCNQCSGCKLENARQWALRIKHEASEHDNNTFITLTYDNEHLPEGGTLVLKDWQDFMKRVRKKYKYKKLSFYHCGEYGEKQGRPHYHAIIFNHQFTDLTPIPRKKDLYTSEQLLKLWQHKGHVSVGSVTFESASYVANYVQKKINGPKAEVINQSNGLRHYERMMPDGEIITLKPEYATMSRNPGIAANWLAKNHKDIYPSDFVTHKGKKQGLPKYYDKQYEILYPDQMEEIKKQRQLKMKKLAHQYTPEALKAKEIHHRAKMALYKREKL